MTRAAPRAVAPAAPTPATGSQSLERGLTVLELLDTSEAPLGVRELARRLELGPTIVQRLLNTLAARGYVEQVAETRRYRIGPRALGLGAALLRTDALMAGAREALERLAHEHGLNGFLGAARGGRLTYLLAVQSPGPIAIRNAPGSEARFHSTAMGKALLAALPSDEADALLGAAPLPRLTPRTITDRAALRADLAAAAARGWAFVDGENLMGVISAGAVIRDAGGAVVAAISVAAPGGGAEAVAAITAPLLPEARQLSARLGCPATLLPPEVP
ncbi:IclR family transcriptional regulator [Plastoroseomonas hellenica]|uniref:IclR family transcriptional regulator n=1 Tax=Plastoroseomonas hellenica TaxID=2687306 RepID=UPI001BA507CD|nr:IclR family transcriptional regulator [Plastoroseomonas hellenica]MBR0646822.1 IclR family transcriptional regulator [Plastoroseomonas hellenica]